MSEIFRHQVSLCGFVAVLVLIALWNLRTLRRLGPHDRPAVYPRVSVLVPARDEAGNIEACLASIVAQNYPDFQVIALNDDSSDETGSILTALRQKHPQLQVLKGKPLPPGWFGKHWACHQLAEAADGEYLLYTDADTRHEPQALRAAMAAIQAERADLLSGFVREETVTWGEKLIVPVMAWALLSFLPLPVAYRLRFPALAAAIGQLMIFRRQAYEQVGGHAAVRGQAADDMALARLIVAKGLRWRMCDATRLVRCRMYHGLGEAAAGFSRSLFAAFDYNALLYVPIWLWLAVVFLEPPAVLGLHLLGAPMPGWSPALAATAMGLSIILWCSVCWRTGLPAYLPLLYPFILLVAEGVAAWSVLLTVSGRAEWKGRRLGRAAGGSHA